MGAAEEEDDDVVDLPSVGVEGMDEYDSEEATESFVGFFDLEVDSCTIGPCSVGDGCSTNFLIPVS